MNFKKNWPGFALTAALLLAPLPPPLEAQVVGGTILGSVKDSSSAVIPAAEVTVQNSDTQVARTATVNEDGFYRVPNLLPGDYQITASAPGFETVVRSGITLTVGGELVVDLQLPLGKVTQKVEVTAEAPTVELSSSSLTDVVNATTVRELPLNGRDWTQLATLQPGVAAVQTQPALSIGNERGNRGWGTQLTIGGNRPQENNYRLDGISINDYSNGAPGSILGVVLGVDAVQEFSVLTNDAPATYGRTSGGVVNAITRSGTNKLHGGAYEFLRNSALDARNFFDKSQVPPFRRNQFGGDAGRPIVRDRTFIFGDYEGLRQGLSVTQLNLVPSMAARSGQLSGGQVVVDPKVKPYFGLYPLPNGAVSGDTGIFNFPTQQVTREDFFTTRVDHTLSPHDSLFGTYFFDDGKTAAPDSFDDILTADLTRRQAVILEETHVFSPALLNSFRFGYSRVVSEAPKTLNAINPLAADTSLGFDPGLTAGPIQVAGLTDFAGGLGAVGEYDFHYNSFQVYDDAFFTEGSHAFKFGGAVERIQANQLGRSQPNGVFIFGSFVNFLTDKPTTFTSALSGAITPRDLRATIVGLYFQDDWRARSNLTLNLGLRYEMSTVPTEAQGKLTNLNSLTDTTPRLGSPYFSNPTKRNFEPRVGFSWDPFQTGKTSVRGAFGLYDDLPLPYLYLLTSVLSAPYFQQGTIANPPPGSFPTGAFGLLTANSLRYAHIESHPRRSYVMQWNLNVQREIAPDLTVFVGYVGSRGVHLPYQDSDVNFVQPTLTFQGYVWPTPQGSGTRLNPNLGQIQAVFWSSNSFYDALQLQVTRRLHRGLQIGGSYTWSKTIDTESSSSASGVFGNSARRLFFDPKSGRGLADFDIRQNFVLNYIWQIPGPRGPSGVLGWATNGWQWGGIYHASGGVPFTPQIGGDPLGMKSSGTFDYPDRLTGPGCTSLVNPGNPIHYIKTQCFVFPNLSTRLGNAGRNILIGPGISDFDMSLFKNNSFRRISERFNVQFRAEFFNISNRANFAPPPSSNRSLFSASGAPVTSAGLIASTLTTSRQIQFGLKLTW